MSAMGSVMLIVASPLPARLDDPGDVPRQGQLAETDSAHLELPQITARSTADPAPAISPDRELRSPLGFGYE
jgi:hypothetical protein